MLEEDRRAASALLQTSFKKLCRRVISLGDSSEGPVKDVQSLASEDVVNL